MDNYLGLRVLISHLIHTFCESSRLNADKNANHSFKKKKKKCKQANGITSALCIYCTDRKSKEGFIGAPKKQQILRLACVPDQKALRKIFSFLKWASIGVWGHMLAFLCFLLMFVHQVFSKDAAVSKKINVHLMLLGFPVTLIIVWPVVLPLQSPEEGSRSWHCRSENPISPLHSRRFICHGKRAPDKWSPCDLRRSDADAQRLQLTRVYFRVVIYECFHKMGESIS